MTFWQTIKQENQWQGSVAQRNPLLVWVSIVYVVAALVLVFWR